jgi:hypothetical protein
MEKQKVLNYYNFFPTVERIIKSELLFNKHDPSPISDTDIILHKYFKNIISHPPRDYNICFIHSCNNGTNQDILISMLDNAIDKMAYILHYIVVINIGQPITFDECHPKVLLINYSDNLDLFEKPTINLMHALSTYISPSSKILYLHTKGISYEPGSVIYNNVRDWCSLMTYFLVDKHKVCMDLLDLYPVVGVNCLPRPHLHYSGNFWWSSANHIRNIGPITSDIRHDCEWWILSGEPRHYELYNSGVDHYVTPFPNTNYVNHDLSDLYKFPERTLITCINLERRPDRQETMTQLLESISLSDNSLFYRAVDGTELLPSDKIIEMFGNNDFGNRRSFIGTALSHYNLWRKLLKSDTYDNYLIMEDDVDIDPLLSFKLNHLLRADDSDILYLGYTCYHSDRPKIEARVKPNMLYTENLDMQLFIGGFFGYVINKSGAEKLVSFIKKNGIKHGIDYLPKKYGEEIGLVQKACVPSLIHTDYVDMNNCVDSDIQYDRIALF